MRRLLFALLLLLPAPVHAQVPGGRVVGADEVRGEFLMRMQIELAAFLRNWENAFRHEAATAPRAHYLADAVVLPPRGSFLGGSDAVRAWLDSLQEHMSDAATSMIDYDASDRIAFVYGPYAFTPRAGDGAFDGGVQLSVLLKEREDWQVRAQLFLPSTGAAAVPATGTQPPVFQLPPDADAATRQRYDRAIATFAALRSGWAEGKVPPALLSPELLLRLPGEATAVRREAALDRLRERVGEFGALQVASIDFATRGRLSYLLGRYYVATPGGPATGAFIIILAVDGRDEKVRALIFT